MVEKKPKNESPTVSSLERVLMERERLNRIIENEFKKDATIFLLISVDIPNILIDGEISPDVLYL